MFKTNSKLYDFIVRITRTDQRKSTIKRFHRDYTKAKAWYDQMVEAWKKGDIYLADQVTEIKMTIKVDNEEHELHKTNKIGKKA